VTTEITDVSIEAEVENTGAGFYPGNHLLACKLEAEDVTWRGETSKVLRTRYSKRIEVRYGKPRTRPIRVFEWRRELPSSVRSRAPAKNDFSMDVSIGQIPLRCPAR